MKLMMTTIGLHSRRTIPIQNQMGWNNENSMKRADESNLLIGMYFGKE